MIGARRCKTFLSSASDLDTKRFGALSVSVCVGYVAVSDSSIPRLRALECSTRRAPQWRSIIMLSDTCSDFVSLLAQKKIPLAQGLRMLADGVEHYAKPFWEYPLDKGG
jgi:hypothetical protein